MNFSKTRIYKLLKSPPVATRLKEPKYHRRPASVLSVPGQILNKPPVGNALSRPARCSDQCAHLLPHARTLRIGRMNADPDQRSRTQTETERSVPHQAHQRSPVRAGAPDKRSRRYITPSTKDSHRAHTRRVRKAEPPNRDLGLSPEQPGGRNEPGDSAWKKREISQSVFQERRCIFL